MTVFAEITPFGLVRALAAAGPNSHSMYLLLCEAGDLSLVAEDLAAEIEVQLDISVRSVTASEVRERGVDETLGWQTACPALLLTLDTWMPELISALDRNITLLESAVNVFILLTTSGLCDRILAAAPNYRNRLTDIFQIAPDAAFADIRT
jgi:hypothetical protein